MALIELKKVLKDGIIIVFIMALLIMGLALTDKDVFLAPVLEVFLILYASFTGWSTFERERQEGAMEYLLSLPISRLRLILSKLMVRIFPVVFMLIIYHLIYKQFSIHFLYNESRFIPIYITVFFLSAAFSLSIKSFLSTFFITLFLSLGLFHFILILDYSRSDLSASIQTAVAFMAILLLFVILFNKYDLKPLSYFNRKFIPALILLVMMIFGITYLTGRVKWRHCYLTDSGELIRVSRGKTVFSNGLQKNRVISISTSLTPLHEHDGKLYASSWQDNTKGIQLVRIDLASGEIEKSFHIPPGYWFHDFMDARATIGDRIYFLLTKYGHKEYQILEINRDKSRIIPVKGDFRNEIFHMICGAAANPLQFFVLTFDPKNHSTGSSLFRILETGRIERLFDAKSVAFWHNRLLRFTDHGMILYDIENGIKEIFKREGEIKKVRRKFENYIQKKVVVNIGDTFNIFDLESQSLEPIHIPKRPYFYYLTDGDDIRLIWTNGPEISVSTWKGDHLQVENVWYTKVKGLKIIRVFKSGIVIYKRSQHEVFHFYKNRGGGNWEKSELKPAA
jgi:ABC-type transport system involved in multi-copper enzyme maturation permease subunit